MEWTTSNKTVAVRRHTKHTLGGLPYFVAPLMPEGVEFTRGRLALTLGRCLALSSAPAPLLHIVQNQALGIIPHIVVPNGYEFALDASVAHLSDAHIMHLAHDIGVGIAGILMEDLGYLWRCNGKQVLPGGKTADYVWNCPTGANQVVLSEVKGSVGPTVSLGQVDARARQGLFEQVADWIGDCLPTGEEIVHGYGIGVHAPGGRPRASIVVHEPVYEYGYAGSSDPRHAVHEDNRVVADNIFRYHVAGIFRAIGMGNVARWIETGMPFREHDPFSFREVEIGNTVYLTSPHYVIRSGPDAGAPRLLGVRKDSAIWYLDALRHGQRESPGQRKIPDGILRKPYSHEDVTEAADGLAVFSARPRPDDKFHWPPDEQTGPKGSKIRRVSAKSSGVVARSSPPRIRGI